MIKITKNYEVFVMKYYVFKKLTDEKFRRLIGVNPRANAY